MPRSGMLERYWNEYVAPFVIGDANTLPKGKKLTPVFGRDKRGYDSGGIFRRRNSRSHVFQRTLDLCYLAKAFVSL